MFKRRIKNMLAESVDVIKKEYKKYKRGMYNMKRYRNMSELDEDIENQKIFILPGISSSRLFLAGVVFIVVGFPLGLFRFWSYLDMELIIILLSIFGGLSLLFLTVGILNKRTYVGISPFGFVYQGAFINKKINWGEIEVLGIKNSQIRHRTGNDTRFQLLQFFNKKGRKIYSLNPLNFSTDEFGSNLQMIIEIIKKYHYQKEDPFDLG